MPCATVHVSFATARSVADACVPATSNHSIRHIVADVDAVTGTPRDVVARQYEGGAKTWECTDDLIAYLLAADDSCPLRGRDVADIGCGTGLAGIAALTRLGAGSCLFQDLNASVLERITACNVACNSDAATFALATFVAGDWTALPAWCASTGMTACVDVLITSETVYRLDSIAPLLGVMRTLLRPGGVAIVSAKRHYYGAELGGGSTAFTRAAQDAGLVVRVVASVADGVSMLRDVLTVTGF